MGIRECLISAAEQGALTREEAAELQRNFDERFAQTRLALGDAPALSQAKKQLELDLRAQAIEKKRRADLTEAARLNLKRRLNDNAGGAFNWAKSVLSHYGFRDGSSVRGRTEAIIATSHARMSEALFKFRRSGILGKRENAALHLDLVKELKGENSGDATAKALARSISEVNEDLRQRFNAAGGAIGKLENWGLAHKWDGQKVKAMGRAAWKAEMLKRLDAAKMKDGLTGQPISAARLEAALDDAYGNIVSGGFASMVPQMRPFGLGALANQRADERFFIFKDAGSWLEMHRMAGEGDVVQAIVNHVNGMAKDIAAMEILGPNPSAMVEWIRQVVEIEYGKRAAGQASLARGIPLLGESDGKAAGAYVGWLWDSLRGNGTVVAGAANFTSSLKNLTTSATLGATGILAAATDPFVAMASRKLAGIPAMKNAGAMLKMISKQSRDDIVRSGVIWEEYLHVMADDLRFAGPMLGAEWTRWIADRAVTWNGLKPLTTGRKLVEARAWQAHIADLAREGVAFDRLDRRFKAALEGFGVNRDDWQIWTASIDGQGFVTPVEIMRRGGQVSYLNVNQVPLTDPARIAEVKALRHREAAEKLAELTSSWSERAVPSGTPNARAVLAAGTQRGTVPGELMQYWLQFKSFGLSFTTLQLEALGQMGGLRSKTGLAYLAALAVPMTIGGAIYNQIRGMLDGKDPEDMTEPAFWGKSALTGGGFGLFGDFIKATENRFGQSLTEATFGPGIAYLSDAFHLARSFAESALTADVAPAGKQTAEFAGRWTPVVSSHPATRLAWRRIFIDNLQWATDPKAHKSFKARISKAKREGAPYWMPPGTLTPGAKSPMRAPNLGNAVGR
jgi:hypothetical protein